MAWISELSPDQAFEAVRTTALQGNPEDIADILDQTSLDDTVQDLARRGMVLEAIHGLAAEELISAELYENIKQHL